MPGLTLRNTLIVLVACISVQACRSEQPQPAAGEPKILRLSSGEGDFLSLDPALADDIVTALVVRQAFVGLTRDDEQTGAVHPGMAESWDVSADGRTHMFHLRRDVPWVTWDGEQVVEVKDCEDPPQVRMVTAQDFEYGIKRSLDPATAATYAYVLAQAIEGAEARAFADGAAEHVQVSSLDDHTLRITFTHPAAYNLAIVGLWVANAQPRWLIEGDACTPAAQEAWTEAGRFQSYGPYTLKSWIHDTSLTLVRNPFWPGIDSSPQARIDEVAFLMLDEAASLTEYEMGNLDSVGVPIGDEDRIRSHPVYSKQLDTGPVLCSYYYGFNTQASFVDDARLRRALSMAIDRQALIDNVAKYDQELARWFSRPGLDAAPRPEQFPDLGIGFDPEAARRELQSYLDEMDLTPEDLALTLMYTDAESNHKEATAVQAMWKDNLGIEVNLDSQEWNFFLDSIRHPEFTPQIWSLGWCADYPDANNFLHDVFAKGGAANRTDGGGVNWINPQYERLVEQAALETDREIRTNLYAEAEQILVREDAVIAPLFWGARLILTRPYVEHTVGIGGVDSYEKWDIDLEALHSGD